MKNEFTYGVIGSTGRLGLEVINVFSEKGHRLVYTRSLEDDKKKENPQVLIDCSLPDAFETNLKLAEESGAAYIIAVTNLTEPQIDKLKALSTKVPVVQSYNFSIGIQILLKLASAAKEIIPDWDIEIEEVHHRFKLDKPSGTAKMIKSVFRDKDVPVTSLRLGNVPGDHTVYFGGLGEVLSIKHSALSRRTFAEGILRSAEFALRKERGFYSFTDVIFG